jgi:subtilisin family serine protease
VKPHIELKLRAGGGATAFAAAPHWEKAIGTKGPDTAVPERALARLLTRHGVPVWVTHAYAPHGKQWSKAEVAAGLDRIYRLVLQENAGIPPALIRDIRLLPYVEYARPGRIGTADLPEPRPAAMSARTDQRSRDAIGLEQAHQYTRGDDSITIAVLDTGVWVKHPELAARMQPGRDFVDILDGADTFIGDYLGADDDPTDAVGHGTHVAGILVARGTAMPDGVAPRCRLLPVRVLGAMRQGERRVGAGLVDNINAAIKWAVDAGADIINMSLGIRRSGGGLPHAEVIEYAKRKGVTVVAAAGNDGQEQLYYPGALDHVIAVGAVDERGEVASFSTFGAQVSMVAPGTNIYSTYLDDDYAFSTGTSHATPFVTGAVALLKSYARSRGRTLSDGQVKHVLKHSADRVGTMFKDRKAGFGRLNLLDAMRLLEHKLERTLN